MGSEIAAMPPTGANDVISGAALDMAANAATMATRNWWGIREATQMS